jgi:putative nucleotidyltransferase with HDIG domain
VPAHQQTEQQSEQQSEQQIELESGGDTPVKGRSKSAFRFLQQLAADLSTGAVSFPTFVDATLRVRRALNDRHVNAERVTRAISAEPMLAARILHVANSVALAPAGAPVGNLKTAILRLGYSNVQSVAMAQLVVAKDMRPFLDRGEAVWRHSVDVAAIAYVLARKLTRINADEALFCGLVHDIGYFYLLSRASKFPELAEDEIELEAVLRTWHAPIGHAVLGAFGLSDAVLTAVAEHDADCYSVPLETLTDVVVAANLLSRFPNPLNRDGPVTWSGIAADSELLDFLESSAAELTSLVAAFRA